MKQEVLESRRAYFQAAVDLLNTHLFQSEIHKEIWRLHSEGLSVREISAKIDKKKFKKTNVAETVRFYKRELW